MERAPLPVLAVRKEDGLPEIAAGGDILRFLKKSLHPIEAVHILFNCMGRPGREPL